VDKTATIATLGPSVRLVVFKFLMKSKLVPDRIPRLPINRSGVTPTVPGVQVMPSTPDVWLAGLRTGLLYTMGDYILVGARANERADGRSDVRFTFCHRQYLTNNLLHPDFVERFHQLVSIFIDLTKSNLWTTMIHLNLYLNKNGTTGKKEQDVLMLDCNGRKEAIQPDGKPVMVYEGGREQVSTPESRVISRGIGPKVSILNKASELKLAGNKVQLVTP